MERIKNYFASANSGNGFVCNFQFINDLSKPAFQYIIKGGSGTGKSTLMKKVGQYFYDKGYNIEYFYCSSDTESLDGIRIVEKNISIIDGTAPHTFDATLPEIENKIINVGEFISPYVKAQEKKVRILIEQKKLYYENLYIYLNSANNLIKINNKIYSKKINNKKINIIVKKIINNIEKQKNNKSFLKRNLFLTALSKKGIENLQNKNSYDKIINFNCTKPECNAIFKKLLYFFEINKFHIICFYDFLDTCQITKIALDNILIEPKIINKNNKIIKNNNYLIKNLIFLAKNNLYLAKKCHNKIEKIYSRNVDFEKINILTNKIISEIEKR